MSPAQKTVTFDLVNGKYRRLVGMLYLARPQEGNTADIHAIDLIRVDNSSKLTRYTYSFALVATWGAGLYKRVMIGSFKTEREAIGYRAMLAERLGIEMPDVN